MLNQLSVQNFNFLCHLVFYLQLHPFYRPFLVCYCILTELRLHDASGIKPEIDHLTFTFWPSKSDVWREYGLVSQD